LFEKTLYGADGSILRSFSQAVEKQFPNLDPNFFKSTVLKAGEDILTDEPYANHVWVYAAVSAIATNLVQLPKVLDLTGTEEQEIVEDHPVLSVFDNPNPYMSASAFWEAIILNLLLPTKNTQGGQCFLIAETGTGRPANLHKGEIPVELYPFNDQNIRPILGGPNKKELKGWMLHGDKGEKIPYDLSEVIRINLYNPYNPLKGLSPLMAAASSVRQDAKASQVNENFFDNNASLGGALSTDAELEDDQIKALRKQWHETYGGSDNAGKTAVLHTGLKFQQFQRTHQDMQFIDQKKWGRDEILAVYRVPKAEVSVYEDVNFATAISADKAFWTKTLLPHDRRILEGFNSQWIQFVEGGKYQLISDTSNVEALQPNFKEKLEQAKALAELLVPVEEINRRLELNLDIAQYPWLSTSLVPFSLTPAERALEEDEPVEVSDTMGDEEEVEEEEPGDEEEKTPEEGIEDAAENLMANIDAIHKADKDRSRFADDYARKVLGPDEKKLKQIISRFFIGQRNRYQDLVDKWAATGTKDAVTKLEEGESLLSFFKLNVGSETNILRKLLLPEFKRQMKNEKAQMEAEMGSPVSWSETSPEAKKALKERLKQIKGVNNTSNKKVAGKIKKVLRKAINENLTKAQTAKLLKVEIRKVYKGDFRANTIARTETGIIHSEARFQIMEEAGVEEIEWLTMGDEKVRPAGSDSADAWDHQMLNGQTTKFGTPFNNGEAIRYPRDTQGTSAGNVINCRCSFRIHKKKKPKKTSHHSAVKK